jgi:hypothetical protein
MLLGKVDTTLGEGEILGIFLKIVIEIGEHPAASALHPNALILGIHLSEAVKAGGYATEFLILAVLQPKGDAGILELGGEEIVIFFHIHDMSSSFFFYFHSL